MNYRHEDQQQRQQLLTLVDRGTMEQLFTFLQGFHRRPFQNLADVLSYEGVIDDQIDFIDCTGTKYNVTPLIITAGKGLYEKTKILLVHGANPNKQCATGDTALNLAVHRQKYTIVDLLLQYHANPNLSNQAGKTALHRAVVSYTNENAKQIRRLLDAGADLNIEDRNQRIPLDEAVTANRPQIVDFLLSHDQTLVKRAYRAAVIASRLGHDKCLETLLNYGMDPNIVDRTNTTPLHVAVRSLQLPIVRILVAHGADRNIANNRGETAVSIAESLQPDQQQNFINALIHTPQTVLSDFNSHKTENVISSVHPLLHNHPNWTLDSDEFRSRTARNSSVQNLLDTSSATYWCCTQTKNAWIIFDLKHQYNLTGVRIIGCENQSTPKNGHFDVSNALNGPWLKVKDFTCLLNQENKNDFFFPSLETRFIRVFILDNYGGEDIRIQGIAFFGVDMRLINLLKEYGLENSLKTLLANGINDQETLYKNQDKILNSSDTYLHINDHFQFIRLMDSLKLSQLTFLEWFDPPQTTIIAGEKLQIFSVAADEGLTDRVKLEEKLENNPQATTVLMKDLEPIQGRSLVEFHDYTIKHPGRYQIRVVSVESPNIHTPWQEVVVGPTSPYASKLNTAADEHLYLSSTTDFNNDTTIDKENTLRSQKNLATTLTNKDNRAFILKVYDNENDDTEDDTYLISLKSIEDSPYYFPSTKMSHTSDSMFVNYQPPDLNISEHFTQTRGVDYYDHSTNTDEGYEDGSSNPSRFDSIPREEIYLTPSKYRSVSRKPLSNIFPNTNINNQKQSDDYETLDFGDRIIIPTKYRLQQDRIKKLLNNENTYYPQEQSQTQIEKQRQPQNQNKLNQELPQQQQSQYDQRKQSRQRNGSESEILPQQQQFRKGTELEEEPLQQQSHYHPKQQYRQQNRLARESSPEQQGSNYHELDQLQKQSETVRESPSQQHQSPYQQRQQPRKRTKSEESLQQQQSQYHQQGQLKNQDTLVQNSFSTLPQQQQSQYHQRQPSRQQNESERESSPPPPQQQQQQQQPNYYEIDESQKRSGLVRESPPRQQQSQYHRQGQLQNQKTWEQNLSSTPPQQQQSQYHQRQQIGQQNESERESSPQQQQANYYEINQSEKQSRFVRESPPRQQQSRQRNELEQDSLYLSPYYDEIPQPRVEPDEEELQVQPHHHQQQRPIEIISQDSSKPIYNRYKVIAGDFELRESPYDNSSPMNASKLGQMQLVFKATLQGPEVQERAKNSISELVSNRSRTQSASNINKQNNLNKVSYPNNPQSSTNVDSRNQNTTNIASNRETEYQIGSNHNSRLNSISHTAQSPTTRTKPDHGNLSSATNYQSFETSSPPNKSIKRTIYDDHPSEIESHRQSNNQSPLPIQVIAANMTTHNANDNDLNGIYERSRSSSQNYTSSKYEKNPLRQADNLHSSQLLSPPRSSPIPFQPKSKYYFGERVQNQLPDDEEDNEADCETFGHNSQPRSLTTTNTTRNLDDPYTTNSRFSMNDNNYRGNLQFGQQTDVGTATSTSLTQRQQNSSSANQSTLGKTRDSPRDSQKSTTNKQIPYAYSVQTTQNAVNQVISNSTSSTSGFQQQDQNESDHSEQNIGRNIKQEQSSSKSDRDRDDANQSQYEGDDDGRDNDNIDEYQDDDHDIHNQNDDEDRTYANNGDDEDDNVVKYDESDETTPRQSGVSELLTYNPVRDTSKDLLPMQYPIIDARLLPSASNISSTTQKNKKKGKKPLEITVRTADHSHLYTPGIIPPKLPSTPTTDITDEITEREPFDKLHTFRHTPDPYIRDSRDNNEEDAEDSDPMSEVRQHNRDRWPKSQSKFKNYGTQSEEKSTRTIGTMSEPVKTRNFGNDAQPQSSATQTSILLQQQSLYKLTEQDDIDLKPSTSQRSQYDTRTNGYYPSQRSTSVGHQNQYVPSSLMSPRQKNYSDYDEHQVPHLSQYNDDPRDQYITTRNDYQRSTIQRPHYSSQTRQHIPPSTNLHRTSPPTVEYRSTSLNDRYRTPSPSNHHHFPQSQRSRSPSPLIQKHISTSTNRQRTASPPSQRRSPSPPIQKHISTSTSRQRTASPPSQRLSRQLQRSPSPPSSRHHIPSSTKLHRTPLPPDEHRSTSPNNRHHSPLSPSKNYSRKTKDRRRMVSAETDTSLDGMKPQQHRGSQPESPSTREYGTTTSTEGKHPTQTSYSTNPNTRASIAQYETLNSSLPKRQDYTITSPYQDNDNLLRNDQPPSTRKNYRLRPVQDDSNVNNYEQIPSKHDESISAEYTRSFDRPKEYTSKPFTGDRHYQASPTFEQRSDEEEQHISITFTDDGSNEKFFRDLPTGGSISIPKSTVIEPDTLPRSHGQNKSPTHQKHDRVQYREKITESPLRHGQQRIASIGDSPPLNFGSENILYQSPNNEFTTPFETRYVHDTDDEFGTANNDIRSSTLKRDGLRPRNNRILLLPVINSSRTYVFEKQALPGNHVRQSRINGNFYLATSPTLHSLNSSFQIDDSEIDSTNLNRYGLRSQVA